MTLFNPSQTQTDAFVEPPTSVNLIFPPTSTRSITIIILLSISMHYQKQFINI